MSGTANTHGGILVLQMICKLVITLTYGTDTGKHEEEQGIHTHGSDGCRRWEGALETDQKKEVVVVVVVTRLWRALAHRQS